MAGVLLFGLVVAAAHAQATKPGASADASEPEQSAAPNATAAATLDTVTVVGHYDTALGSSNAASQGVVEGSTLTDAPVPRPGQILETVPGLVVTQHSGDGKANQYFLRGYNLDHGTDLATFVDAVPVNMPTNAHGQGYTDLNFVIPELVDHIDYEKGPYFAPYGDFASAGAVAIRYRDTLDGGLANLTLGDDAYRRLLFAGSCTVTGDTCAFDAPQGDRFDADSPRLLGALELLEENGPWTLPEHLHKFNGLVRLSEGTPENGFSVDAIAYAAHWDSTDQVPLSLIESGQLNRYGALDPTDGGDSARDVLSGEWAKSAAGGYLKAAFFLEHYQLQLWSDFTFYELRPRTGDQFEQAENRNLVGGQIAEGWAMPHVGLESLTEAGVQMRHDNIDVGLFDTEARHVFATVSNEIVGETEAGLYIENTTLWTPWLKSTLGLRENLISLSADSLSTAANSGNASASKLTPKMALVIGPWHDTEFFVDAGEGFHSNDARGVIDKIDPTTGLAALPVAALAGSFGKEIGVRTAIIPGLQSSLALWSLNSQSELVYNADSDIGSTSPDAASKRYGIEWNNHFVSIPHLLLDLDLAYTHARYAQDNQNGQLGDDIPNAVAAVASFRATLMNFGPWSAGIETRYIGAYPLSQDGSLRNPGAAVTNVRFQRQLTKRTAIIVDGLNLFDKQYYDIAYEQDYRVTPTSPIVPNGVTVHPGEPRAVRVTLSTRF